MDVLNFNSLDGGFIPICLLAGLCAVFWARMQNYSLGMLLNCVSSIAVAILWYQMVIYMWPVSPWENGGAWAWAAIFLWSVFAIPTSVFVYIALKQSKRSQTRNLMRNDSSPL
jgi:uncharacterized membrane protein